MSSKSGLTALMLACSGGFSEIVKLLLSHDDAKVNFQINFLDVVTCLLDHHAEMNLVGSESQTPLVCVQ